MTFNQFANEAASLFGLSENEASDLWDELEQVGFYPEIEAPREMWEVAADLIYTEYEGIGDEPLEEEFYEYSPYDLDPSWPDDDYLDAGEEWELTPFYSED